MHIDMSVTIDNRICKHCGSPIQGISPYFWYDPGYSLDCSNTTGQQRHEPLLEEDIVTSILEKYGQES